MPRNLEREVKRRRCFAIISHPDAGKTTMTEKLLLYGGAIRSAGAVKARKAAMHATSDWMEIEKQRGISVTSSVMQFEYDGYCVNILDTPGHQDFSEDTYRTLCAADAAVMMIDAGRGVEKQTIKLFEVCHMRGIPIFTFINKMDRAAKSPFDLMDELEKVLGIRSAPINWPIGTHGDFKGVYDREKSCIELFDRESGAHGSKQVEVIQVSLDDPHLADYIGSSYVDDLNADIELLDIAGDPFDLEAFRAGQITPMFFGSALTNFGVESFLRYFLDWAPAPGPRKAETGEVDPIADDFSAFVFKIQANMNPAHRDRLAFIRICSGVFEKNMEVSLGSERKKIRLTQPQQFMAQEHKVLEEAYPGDIIGLFDPGVFRIGDSLYAGNSAKIYGDIPIFPPEHFARIEVKDSMKRKQFIRGMEQLSQEGAVQLYKQEGIGTETYTVGVVGVLQLDVLSYRLENEYKAEIVRTDLPYRYARWIDFEEGKTIDLDDLVLTSTCMLVRDRYQRPVLLFESPWAIDWVLERNKGMILQTIAEAK
ncbi:MAG: peptide chain release factor 3 [Eubacteriales bacterium]|nr:peptide chain release factor 3 [Eubacteriales bacterium]